MIRFDCYWLHINPHISPHIGHPICHRVNVLPSYWPQQFKIDQFSAEIEKLPSLINAKKHFDIGCQCIGIA
jgi:hypothetical protein